MKPQCETTADCLEQLARVMREFGFTSMIDAIRSEFIHYDGEEYNIADKYYIPHFDHSSAWSFAIAKLEDKPVFLGSRVFDQNGREACVTNGGLEFYRADGTLSESMGFAYGIFQLSGFSWTPPKQTVSLKIGGNEPVEVEKAKVVLSGGDDRGTFIQHDTYEAAEQFRKAMKPFVKEKS